MAGLLTQWSRIVSWPRRRPQAIDTTIAVVAWLLLGMLWNLSTPDPIRGPGTLLGLALSGLHLLPLAVRRSHPTTAFTLVSLGCLAQLLTADAPMPSDLGFLAAAHALAGYGRHVALRRAGLVVALLSGLLGGADWYTPYDTPADSLATGITLSGMAIVAWLWGDVTRRRREVVQRLHEQNEALRRDRDQRARIAAQDERTRIAREMHDIVAHSLSVVVVQADGAAYVAGHAPGWERAQAVAALGTIARTAREALAETPALVGVLRAGDGPGATANPASGGPTTVAPGPGTDGAAEYAPTNTLAALPDLLDRVRDSGLTVRFAMDPALAEPGRLPIETSLAAYRIAQESLTNVIKHAGESATVDVTLALAGDELTVDVADDGRGAARSAFEAGGYGHGLIGMVERAESIGGRFTAGPRPGGGFRVAARLPDPRGTSEKTGVSGT